MKVVDKEISSPAAMRAWAAEMAKELKAPGLILGLKGEVGAGKTTFVKGFISSLLSLDPRHIQSPTFQYLQVYEQEGREFPSIYHFDLYRLQEGTQFVSAGFCDYFYMGGICCIEWVDRIESLLPPSTVLLEITYRTLTTRHCQLFR